MDHDSIRNKLSAYLDGAVTPAEKSLIEKHLAECRDCRDSLRELEKTVAQLRNLGDVAPPPWLTVKVMARVREEAGRKRGLLRRLLDSTVRWKIPVEAAALVFLTVTGYLVYRNVSSEVKQLVPMSDGYREEYAPPVSPPPVSRKAPVLRAPAQKSPSIPMKEKRTAAPAPRTPSAESLPSSIREEASRAPSSSAETLYQAEEKGMGYRVQERAASKSASPPSGMSFPELEDRAPAGMMRSKALPTDGMEVLRIEISVADPGSAEREIERATGRSGGVIFRSETDGEERVLVVRLQRKSVQGYLERLESIGDFRGTVPTVPDGDDAVEIRLTVTPGRQ
jgi:hypothetical protein